MDSLFFLQIQIIFPREFSLLPCIFCTEVSEEKLVLGKCANHRFQMQQLGGIETACTLISVPEHIL